MRKFLFIFILFLVCGFNSFGQEFIDDSNFEDKINHKEAFGDDEANIVIVEFWAKFNDINAFQDWEKVDGVKYYRCDISKAPKAAYCDIEDGHEIICDCIISIFLIIS